MENPALEELFQKRQLPLGRIENIPINDPVQLQFADIRGSMLQLQQRTEGIQASITELARAIDIQHNIEMENVDMVVEGGVSNVNQLAINLHRETMQELLNIKNNIRNYNCNGFASLTSITELLKCVELFIMFLINTHVFLAFMTHRILFVLQPLIQQIPYIGELLKLMYFICAFSIEALIYMTVLNFYGSIIAIIVAYSTSGQVDVSFLNKLGIIILKKMGYIIGHLFKTLLYLLTHFKDVIMTVPNILLEGFKESNATDPINEAIEYSKEFTKNQTNVVLKSVSDSLYNATIANAPDLGIANAKYGAEYVYNASSVAVSGVGTGVAMGASAIAETVSSFGSYINFFSSKIGLANTTNTTFGGNPTLYGITGLKTGLKSRLKTARSIASSRRRRTSKTSPKRSRNINFDKKVRDLEKIKSIFLNLSTNLTKFTQESDITSPKIQKFAKLFEYEQTRFKKGIFHFIDTIVMISSSAIVTMGSYSNISHEQSNQIKFQLEKVESRGLVNIEKYIHELKDICDIEQLDSFFGKQVTDMNKSLSKKKTLQRAYSI